MLSEAMKSSPMNSLMLTKIAANPSKFQKHCNDEVRRSGRLQNAVIYSTIQLPDSELLTAADGNAEALELHKEEQVVLPSPTEKNLEAKLDVLEKQIEALQSSMNALQSKVQQLNCRVCPHDADVDNRTLHLDCQKKIDALTSANCDLTSKLDDAQSKLERYEKRQRPFSDFLDKLKNTNLLQSCRINAIDPCQAVH